MRPSRNGVAPCSIQGRPCRKHNSLPSTAAVAARPSRPSGIRLLKLSLLTGALSHPPREEPADTERTRNNTMPALWSLVTGCLLPRPIRTRLVCHVRHCWQSLSGRRRDPRSAMWSHGCRAPWRTAGPTAQGEWFRGSAGLGFRRLAIIDLVTGDQPMVAADGQVAIVFNGEIYNHPELRARLEGLGHAFRTRSDTETILRGYLNGGAASPAGFAACLPLRSLTRGQTRCCWRATASERSPCITRSSTAAHPTRRSYLPARCPPSFASRRSPAASTCAFSATCSPLSSSPIPCASSRVWRRFQPLMCWFTATAG